MMETTARMQGQSQGWALITVLAMEAGLSPSHHWKRGSAWRGGRGKQRSLLSGLEVGPRKELSL